MPFLSPMQKAEVNEKMKEGRCLNEGELTYVLTKLIVTNWHSGEGNYAALCQIIGALECTKMQFFKEIVVPYEEKKKQLNGDVYENQNENPNT